MRYACDRCNYDMHTCHGCGTSLPHGMELCPRCEWEATR